MAPVITAATNISKGHLHLNIKLRKPVVEKMRRDRINSCIEQLKTLLASEFLMQQPDSRLEKADILEITVNFLNRQQQKKQAGFSSSSEAVNQGFSRCVHEVVQFLSRDEVQSQCQRKMLNHLQNIQSSSDQKWRESDLSLQRSPDQPTLNKEKSALWRPW